MAGPFVLTMSESMNEALRAGGKGTPAMLLRNALAVEIPAMGREDFLQDWINQRQDRPFNKRMGFNLSDELRAMLAETGQKFFAPDVVVARVALKRFLARLEGHNGQAKT